MAQDKDDLSLDLLNKFMQKAIAQAKRAESHGEVPIGAILLDENLNIVARGFNKVISSNDSTAHAEIVAMRAYGRKINNYRYLNTTLVVTLEPCAMCVGALIHARVKRVIFGSYNQKTGACSSVFNLIQDERHNHKIEVIGGVLEEECTKLLSDFFKRRRFEKKIIRDLKK